MSTYNGVRHKILELCNDLAERMERKSVGGSNLTLNMKTTKFDIQSKAMAPNSYIWSKDDLKKYALQILDQAWPLEPLRLLGIRMSSLRSIADIKKDKSLNDFFGTKLTKEERAEEIRKNNERVAKERIAKAQPEQPKKDKKE